MSSRLRTRLRAGTGLSTPSLSLEFQTATGALDPRITFSRTSQATLVDSTGKLTYAPNNLLTNSETFEAAAWSKTGFGVAATPTVTANAGVAPDGTTTAERVQFNCVDASSVANRSFLSHTLSQPAGVKYIGSVWVKAFDAGNVGKTLRFAVDAFGSNVFTLTDQWQRITISGLASTTVVNFIIETRGTFTTQTADVLIWGAQLEQVTYQTAPGTYNSTSPKNLLGYTQEFDNAAWTKSNAFVQTNLFAYTQRIGDAAAWGTNATTATINSAVAPDGTTTASTLTADGTSNIHRIQQTYTGTTATQTFSFYAKAGTNNFTQLYLSNDSQAFANFDLAAGVVGTKGTAVSASSITSVGGGWYRCVAVITSGVSSTAAYIVVTSSASAVRGETNTLSTSILLWGAQLVQGSTAGDYQRTDAAAAAVQYVAPDGSRTADKLVETTATASHTTFAGPTATVASTPYTASVYLKAGERRYAIVGYRSSATNTAWAAVVVDLLTGTVGTPTVAAGASNVSASIFDAGNGWYRVRITATITAADGQLIVTLSDVASPTISNYVVYSYTGDGTSGIYIWGAQLSNSASLDPYVYNPVAAPTSAAYYGPRFDYDPVTLANKGLLIEEQRTNLLTYSDQFDNAIWGKTNSTIAANVIVSPDGTVNADKLQEDSATAGHVLVANPTMAASTTYTLSIYMKAAERTFGVMNIYTGAASCWTWFNLSTGVVSTLGAGATATITPAANGWYRCTLTIATAATGTPNVAFWPANANGSLSYAGTTGSGIYIYGAQLEAGSFATSYIPTVASQVTRTADVALMQGANFSNWYNQNEGTFTVDYRPSQLGSYTAFSANNNTTNFRMQHTAFTGGSFGFFVSDNNITQANINAGVASVNSANKVSTAYKANDFAASLNGGAAQTDTSGTVPVVDRLFIGSLTSNMEWINGHIRRIGYYPTRLANDQLQSLTAQSTIPSLSLDFTTQVFNVG